MTELKITQADRVAAANYGLDNSLIFSADYEALTSGRRDDNRLVQAFARHRIAAEEGKAELAEALEDLLAHRDRPPSHAHPEGAFGEIAMWKRARAAHARVRGEG